MYTKQDNTQDNTQDIDNCNSKGDSTEFMLKRINETLDNIILQSKVEGNITSYVNRLLSVMEYDECYSSNELLTRLNLKSKEALRHNYLDPAIEMNLIEMTIPAKPTSRNQRYRKK